jgi:hypothetical protein
MGAIRVIEPEVGRQARLQLADSLITINVDILVF